MSLHSATGNSTIKTIHISRCSTRDEFRGIDTEMGKFTKMKNNGLYHLSYIDQHIEINLTAGAALGINLGTLYHNE